MTTNIDSHAPFVCEQHPWRTFSACMALIDCAGPEMPLADIEKRLAPTPTAGNEALEALRTALQIMRNSLTNANVIDASMTVKEGVAVIDKALAVAALTAAPATEPLWDEWNVEKIAEKLVNRDDHEKRQNCTHAGFDVLCMRLADWLNEVGYPQPTKPQAGALRGNHQPQDTDRCFAAMLVYGNVVACNQERLGHDDYHEFTEAPPLASPASEPVHEGDHEWFTLDEPNIHTTYCMLCFKAELLVFPESGVS